jgi:hypothetical protein
MQYAIGQGGFHVAEIRVGGKKFRYIYDCGAKNRQELADKINAWPSDDKAFDWLVISSFDADHFNCATDLLDAGFSFKAVILPHLLNADLFKYLFLSYIVNGMEAEDLAIATKVFSRMIAGDFGLVLPGSDPDNVLDDINGDGLVDTEKLLSDSVSHVAGGAYRVQDADWMLRFYSVEASGKDSISTIFNVPSLAKLKGLIGKIGASLLKTVAEDTMKELLAELKDELDSTYTKPAVKTGTKATASRTGDASNLIEEKIQIGKTIKQILGLAFSAMKKDGKKLIHDYNSASLCLYSGPIPEHHEYRHHYLRCTRTCSDQRHTVNFPSHGGRVVGWIGVGDITFKNSTSVNSFIKHYSAELMLAGTRMLPHHGAQSNYDPEFAHFRKFADTIPKGSLWVAAADPARGGYRHPDGIVVIECLRTSAFHLVSADPATTLEETICLDC